MKKINEILERHSSPMKIFIAFVLFILNFSVFRVLTPEFKKMSGGLDIPDITLIFSHLSPYELFTQFGARGREYYSYIQAVDLIYPLIYCIFFSLLLAAIGKKIFRSDGYRWINLLPLVTAIFDYGENISIFIMNRIYPGVFGLVESAGWFLSLGKWILFICMILVSLAWMILYIVFRKLNRLQPV